VLGNTSNSTAIQADYCIVLDASHASAAKCYQTVVSSLQRVGLEVTSRPGSAKSHEILIFVRASQAKIYKALEAERIDDWKNGVFSTRPDDPRERREFAQEPPSTSERLRIVYEMINGVQGAGIVVKQAPFEAVMAIFPPHDPAFNKNWLESWTKKDTIWSIPEDQLIKIKNHFGEAIALYFEFLRFYFSSLVIPASVGLVTWFSLGTYSIVYSFIVVTWSLLMIEGWRIRERMLAVQWGTYNVSSSAASRERPQFRPTEKAPDRVHGGMKGIFPWYLRDLRVLSSVPVLLVVASALVALIALIFTSEVLINEVYDGKGKTFLSLLPTMGFAGVVPQVVALGHQAAIKLTEYENHKTVPVFERSLILKMFALNAIVAFGTLSLTAYAYIPFGTVLIPDILSFIHRSPGPNVTSSAMTRGFSINSERLTNTLFALSTTTQIIGFVNEVVVPFAMRFVSTKVNDRRESKGEKRSTDAAQNDESQEKEYLERIRKEASLPEYSTFLDYAEMVQQFGYVCLWSVAWPLCPVAALVNNFFELRGDAFKICINQRRTAPKRVESIGPWLDLLGALTWIAAITNASLIYMFQPRTSSALPVYAQLSHKLAHGLNVTANALNMTDVRSSQVEPFRTTRIHQATVAPGSSYYNIRTTVFTALLLGLASERIYQALRALTRHIMEELFWKQTPEAAALAKSEYKLKDQYVSAMGLENGQPEEEQPKRSFNEPAYGLSEAFWQRGDLGLQVLESSKSKTA